MGHTWYLEVEFHLFLLAPILIKLLFKHGDKIVPPAILIVIAGGLYRTYELRDFFDGEDFLNE